ncbi:MAG: TonB-dependent siderophore receptor, partial [Brevundimonas sp.]
MKKASLLNRTSLTAVGLSGLVLMAATAAQAQQQNFNIPPGDLRAALTAYETATGQTLRLEADNLAGRTTAGARGALSPQQALARLLNGTRLRSCPGEGGYAIVEAAQSCASTSQSADGTTTQVADVIVTGTAVSHLADRSRTGTRMDADPMTLPLSVSTVSEGLLIRQQALTLADAVANVAGVTASEDGSFSMRGFSAGVMRNGNLSADGTMGDVPLVAVSRVEVVKGPEAIIAGVASRYGGVVNVITKTPQAARVADFTSTLGSRGYYDVGMDVGGAVNEDKTVLVRLVASTQNTDRTLSGYDGPSSDYIAPSLTWRMPSWGTEITAQYEYQDSRKAPDLVVFAFGEPLNDDLPVARLGPKDDGSRTESRVATLSLEQKINEDWSIALRYSHDERDRVTNTGLNFVGTDFGLPFPSIFT